MEEGRQRGQTVCGGRGDFSIIIKDHDQEGEGDERPTVRKV